MFYAIEQAFINHNQNKELDKLQKVVDKYYASAWCEKPRLALNWCRCLIYSFLVSLAIMAAYFDNKVCNKMVYPTIDPVAVSLGPLQVHWYGLMYLLGFVGAWWLGRVRAKQKGWTAEEVEDLLFYGAIGVILGGRLGYALFYDLPHILAEPLALVKVWQGGMSFHGGLLGVLTAFWLFSRKTGKSYFTISDFIAPMVPIGLLFGRIGNFINGELWGKVSDVPWAMIFPTGGPEPRHPSQLYEAGLEGLALFIILWWYSAKPRPLGAISGLFLLGYGVARFVIEFVRTPDQQYGYFAFNWLTMGQILSLPMVIFGVFLMVQAYRGRIKGE